MFKYGYVALRTGADVSVRSQHFKDPPPGYILRNQFAIAHGSNRTQEPIRKEGMRPVFASLKTVMRDTANNRASSRAVRA